MKGLRTTGPGRVAGNRRTPRCVATGWLLSLLTVLAVTGCTGDRSGESEAGKRPFRVAVIPKGTGHEFWKAVEAGARAAGDDFDDVVVTWKGPLSEGETSDQIKTVESFVADSYDGICLAPLDADALRKKVDQAIAAGIPVVVFDSALRDNSGIVSYVASNNYKGGEMAADYLAELLEDKGQVMMLRYEINSESTEQREQGFLDRMKAHPAIDLISIDRYAGPEEKRAIEKAENMLQSFGDQVDGIFCPNESTSSGMLTALRRSPQGLVGKVKFVGFDAGENLEKGLHEGFLHGTVLQDPYQMGYESVRVMRNHLRGEEVPKRIETRLTVAKHDDLDNRLTEELLHPKLAR
ncbi:MAG: substrate-binding domain-containing protein [Pirellulales bacterium]